MLTRRLFVRSSAMAMLSMGFAPPFLARAAQSPTLGRRLLVVVFQRGAADGLNMVVPHGDADYYRLRPTIAVARPGSGPAAALDLDGRFGLHPSLAPLKPYWDNETLAIVHACGSPDPTRSHFDAQDYMESATPGVKSTRDGWLNRYLDTTPQVTRNPLRGVALARRLPRSLQGPAPTLAVGSLDGFVVRGGAGESFEAAYRKAADTVLAQTSTEAFDAMRTLQRAAARPDQLQGGAYPRSPLGQALREIATIAKADVGLEVAFAETTNWDHHVNQGGSVGLLASRLDDLARALAALVDDLGARMSQTIVLTMSEFGRRAAENGTGGTDHGHGNAMFIIGRPVRGGRVHGHWPGLESTALFEGRDLAVTTDFRDVFSAIARAHLGADRMALARIFPGFTAGPALQIVG